MDEQLIHELISRPESEHLDFKEKWWDMNVKAGRGDFVKDALAMANSLHESESAYIVVGVSDDGVPMGVSAEDRPTEEQISQILGAFTHSTPKATPFFGINRGDVELDVIQIDWSPYQPHYATRDVQGTLSARDVYTRIGSTNGVLSLPEVETLIRAKDARLGHPVTDGPLAIGFVEIPMRPGEKLAVRILNQTEEPVEGIWAVVDVELVHPQGEGWVTRDQHLNGLTLQPGESREFSFNPHEMPYSDLETRLKHQRMAWGRWVNVRLQVTYRGRSGLLEVLEREISLA